MYSGCRYVSSRSVFSRLMETWRSTAKTFHASFHNSHFILLLPLYNVTSVFDADALQKVIYEQLGAGIASTSLHCTMQHSASDLQK